jgi:glycosyltransferase involved in cell wall biosynthesis
MLVRNLVETAPEHEYHLYCLDRRAPDVIGLSSGKFVYHLLKPSARILSMLASLPLSVARSKPDVFHGVIVGPVFAPKGMVMTMGCSSLIRHPEFYPPLIRMRLRFLVHRALPKAVKVICPTEHVRNETIEEFKLSAERVSVVYPGVDCSMFRPLEASTVRATLEERYAIRYPYFLFSGRWEKRKNIIRTIEAFALFKRTTPCEHRLVLTGDSSWAANEVATAISRLGIQDAVVDLGKTPWRDLPYLYCGAEALVFASLWEGFGFPIVESMACGTPVITSNVSAMPETAGGAGLLVDPSSVEDIAGAMHRIAGDAELRRTLRTRGLERVPLFSWQNTARKMLGVYKEVGENGKLRSQLATSAVE